MASYSTEGEGCFLPSSNQTMGLAPDFSELRLFDDGSISEVLDIVLKAKSKTEMGCKEKETLTRNVESFAKGNTLRHLQNLREADWNSNKLDGIPLICKVYLRLLLKEAGSYCSKQELLQYDFNGGHPIILTSSMQHRLAQIKSFGFDHSDCVEAIIVTQRKETMDAAVNYLLLGPEDRNAQYLKMKNSMHRSAKKMKKRVLPVQDDMKQDEDEERRLAEVWTKMDSEELSKEIERMKHRIDSMKLKKQKLESDIANQQISKKLVFYQEFVGGILAEPKLNIEEMSEWKKRQKNASIKQHEHESILGRFGHNEESLDKIKSYSLKSSTTPTTGKDSECVVCYSEISWTSSAFMITPCHHICLCSQCASAHFPAPHSSQKCPLCCRNVEDVKKVYFC